MAVIVLAAGESSRLGSPKQLLPYADTTLVRHAVSTALGADAKVMVVLGSEADRVSENLRGLPVTIVENLDWRDGMASSIRAGMAAIAKEDSAVIALCDQPKITAAHLKKLSEAVSETKPIAASSYDGVLGAPCAFHRTVFSNLISLKGDEGARELIRNATYAVRAIPFEEGQIDVDTPEDYKRLLAE